MYKFQWYQSIYDSFPGIVEEARRYGEEIGTLKLKQDIGLYAGSSARPGNLPDYVLDAIVEANRGGKTYPVRVIEDELREVVKDVYGDEYDAVAANTCESLLRLTLETLCAPPSMRHGDIYRGRVLMPYGEDYEWIGGYGRAFPPRYKNLLVDRTIAGGELGIENKSLANLETLYVPHGRSEIRSPRDPVQSHLAAHRRRRGRHHRKREESRRTKRFAAHGHRYGGIRHPQLRARCAGREWRAHPPEETGRCGPGLRRTIHRRHRRLDPHRRHGPAGHRLRHHHLQHGQARPRGPRRDC